MKEVGSLVVGLPLYDVLVLLAVMGSLWSVDMDWTPILSFVLLAKDTEPPPQRLVFAPSF